jgi:hypothetical protein
MSVISADIPSNPRDAVTSRAQELLNDRQGTLPVWIRAPKSGPEYFTGFSRSKLYEPHSLGKIKSKSIREPGQIKGTRLFNLKSILDFIDNCQTKEAALR